MKLKEDIINRLGEKYNYKNYLEISTRGTGHSFDKVKLENKDCLNYSVSIYKDIKNRDHDIVCLNYDQHLERLKNQKFDIILVDSYHTVEHTLRDLETALQLVSDKGIIVVHDCNPPSENLIGEFTWGCWSGQSYEAFILFRQNYPEMETFVIEVDYGCGIVRPNKKQNNDIPIDIDLSRLKEWNYFYPNRQQFLNLITVNDFILRFQL